jgi:hypothetical protein
MDIPGETWPRPAHLSSELKYGTAMRHTVASVERMLFTDSLSPEDGHQGLEGMEELAGVRLKIMQFPVCGSLSHISP